MPTFCRILGSSRLICADAFFFFSSSALRLASSSAPPPFLGAVAQKLLMSASFASALSSF
jgi:hypothetical protein